MVGHSGFLKSHQRIKKDFFWEELKKYIQKFIRERQVCQRNKGEITKTPWLLQPLHIPNQTWEEISMYLIIGLPKHEGKDSIFVAMVRLTKYAHFCRIQSKQSYKLDENPPKFSFF
jgi:hypothetical protein